MNQDFYNYKRSAVKAARDLGYSPYVIEKIKEAKTDVEIEAAMRRGRYERFDK